MMACISVDRHQIYGRTCRPQLQHTKGAFYVYSTFLNLDSFAFVSKSALGFLDNENKVLRSFGTSVTI